MFRLHLYNVYSYHLKENISSCEMSTNSLKKELEDINPNSSSKSLDLETRMNFLEKIV